MLQIQFKNSSLGSKIFDKLITYKINNIDCHLHRDASVKNLVINAFENIDKEILDKMKPFKYSIDSGDHGSFSGSTYSNNLVADFNFDKWTEVGNYDYHDITQQMLKLSYSLPTINKLFWMGSYDCHWTRKKLGTMTQQDHRISIINVDNWHWDDKLKKAVTNNGKYTSMIDHCQYKYLIDFQGYGYSGRTKYLLHSGRPLFYIDRDCHEYWYFDMKPMEHFIPIKSDLSDFYEKFEWAENNYNEALKIADNARIFAMNNLKRKDAVSRYKKQILEWGAYQDV